MGHFDASHQQTQTEFPDPLAGTGLWHMGTWALPATTLSIASAGVFILVLGFLLHEPQRRALFELPFAPGAVAVATALAAWGVTLGCRHRPGRQWPRYWSLLLAGATTATALGCLLGPQRLTTSLLHALVVAGMAAVLTLLPRLARARPNSKLVQRVAPLAVLVVLLAILPSACYVGQTVIDERHCYVDQHVLQLQRWAATVREVTGYDWSVMTEDPEEAAATVGRLGDLSFAGALADPRLWHTASVLDRDQDLARASRDLMDVLVAGLAPQRTPKLSLLDDPAVRWDIAEKRWIPSFRFPGLSTTTAQYHRHLGRLFHELELLPGGGSPAVELETYSNTKRAELQARMRQLAKIWTDGWPVYLMPGHEDLVGTDRPLVELLQAPVIVDSATPLAAADLRRLLKLSLAEAQDLVPRAPGCRTPEYAEEERQYWRLDCYAYGPASDAPAAWLRIELRLVYESQPGEPLRDTMLPTEVYFLFPYPPGVGPEPFHEEVMAALAAATRELSSGDLNPVDRGGSELAGFRFGEAEDEIRVSRPRDVDFRDGHKAVEVRALRTAG